LARLEWEKANRRERRRRQSGDQRAQKKGTVRQQVIADFVESHGIGCFKCGAPKAEWAKSGISKRGPWAICVPCVWKEKASK
jgi:hypothetical protein